MAKDYSFLSDKHFWLKFLEDCEKFISFLPGDLERDISVDEVEDYPYEKKDLRLFLDDNGLDLHCFDDKCDSCGESYFHFPGGYPNNYVAIGENRYGIKPGLYSKRRFVDSKGENCYGKENFSSRFYRVYNRKDCDPSCNFIMKDKTIPIDLEWLSKPEHTDIAQIACLRIIRMPIELRYFFYYGAMMLVDEITEWYTNDVKDMVAEGFHILNKYSFLDKAKV